MSSSRVQTTFTGAPPIPFETSAASTAIVGLRFAAEAAAQQRHVDGDVLGRKAEHLGHQIVRGLRALHAGPDLRLAVGDARRRRRRLHRRMGEMRDVVFGLDLLGGAGERRLRSRLRCARPEPGLRAVASSVCAIGLRVVGRVGAVVPLDLQRLAALDRRPGVVGDHRDAAQRQENRRRGRRRDLDDLSTTPAPSCAAEAS